MYVYVCRERGREHFLLLYLILYPVFIVTSMLILHLYMLYFYHYFIRSFILSDYCCFLSKCFGFYILWMLDEMAQNQKINTSWICTLSSKSLCTWLLLLHLWPWKPWCFKSNTNLESFTMLPSPVLNSFFVLLPANSYF